MCDHFISKTSAEQVACCWSPTKYLISTSVSCHYWPQLSGCVSGDCADVTTAEATIGSTGVPAPIKSLTLTTLTPTQSPSMMETRGCVLVTVLLLLTPGEGCVPAAPPATTTTTAPPQPTAGPQTEWHSSLEALTFCAVHSIASFLVIMNIASYARPNYQYLPSFLYFTQKIANAAIIGKMRILWSRNVRNNTCCKHFLMIHVAARC